MKLIADSGSTKTDWRLISESDVLASFQTEGLNPYFKSKAEIEKVLENDVINHLKDKKAVESICFYGAGCSSKEKNKVLEEAFSTYFINSEINIEHDLLGASIAACGNEKGIAIILGTGSNSCVFDGSKIIEEQNSLGFILGDEGAGSYLGKQLLIDFLYRKIPVHLSEDLKNKFDLSKTKILEKVYKEKLPNHYLARFVKWIVQNIDKEDYLQNLVLNAFDDFFRTHIINYSNYKDYKLNTVGSVGFYLKEYLHIIAFKYDIKIGSVIKAPIDGLVHFHQNQ